MVNEKEFLKETTEKLLSLMDFDGECFISEKLDERSDSRVLNCKINVRKNSNFLIGQYGTTLQALESVLKTALFKKGIRERIVIDINDYRENKKINLRRLASDLANQVAREKKPQILKPMSAFERRIVHVFLEDDNRVVTESVGEGENRKVVIKPKSIMESL